MWERRKSDWTRYRVLIRNLVLREDCSIHDTKRKNLAAVEIRVSLLVNGFFQKGKALTRI